MRRARATALAPGPISEVEALWYDLRRWPAFVDGFGAVVSTDGDWPETGGVLIWNSAPAGRGRVLERVTSHALREGQVAEVEDSQLAGTQRIAFAPSGDDVKVELVLEYELKSGGPLMPVVDVLFIRRALRDSLRRTLTRFAHEREGDVALDDTAV